jgi:hypothetical protein
MARLAEPILRDALLAYQNQDIELAKSVESKDDVLDEAYKAAVPNQFQKDFIEADKKVNLLYSALSGQILKVFPVPNDPNNKWVSFLEVVTSW